jgi:hypothetical protein
LLDKASASFAYSARFAAIACNGICPCQNRPAIFARSCEFHLNTAKYFGGHRSVAAAKMISVFPAKWLRVRWGLSWNDWEPIIAYNFSRASGFNIM